MLNEGFTAIPQVMHINPRGMHIDFTEIRLEYTLNAYCASLWGLRIFVEKYVFSIFGLIVGKSVILWE